MHSGVIIQARLGSTRLPGKMMMPFYKDKSLFEVILENISVTIPVEKICLATSTKPENDALCRQAVQHGIHVYRGSENDVLVRFVEAARALGWESVVRVCADNPFLYSPSISKLITLTSNNLHDYASWFFKDGTPAIRTHSGYYPEWVRVSALEKVNTLTKDSFYHEHVTNYIYEHDTVFKLKKLFVEEDGFLKNIRLTIDTQADFDRSQKIFRALYSGKPIDILALKKYLSDKPDILLEMKNAINSHAK